MQAITMLKQAGRTDEAIRWLQHHADTGRTGALREAARNSLAREPVAQAE
jgi:hypothetical protein